MQHAIVYGPPFNGAYMADTELHEIRRNIPFKEKEFNAVKAKADSIGSKFATFVRRAAVREAGLSAEDVTEKPLDSVPLIGTIHAGDPADCRDEERREIICSEHPNGDSYRYLEVEGDCMDKQVPAGALALFRDQGYVPGQTVAVLVDCELMLRVYQFDTKFKCIRLDPDSTNPAHKPFLVREDDPKSKNHVWIKPENMQFRGVFTGGFIVRTKSK